MMKNDTGNTALGVLVGLIGGFALGAYFFSRKESKLRSKVMDELDKLGGVVGEVKSENLEELEKIQQGVEKILENIESRIKSLSDYGKEE